MKEIPIELMIDLLDSAIDELAKVQNKLKILKEKMFRSGGTIISLTEENNKYEQRIKNLESENESLRCSESFHETRDHNRARRVGQQLQEGSNGQEV